MAIVTCPKCPTGLRISDGVSGNVKCPKCNTLFPVVATVAPAPPASTTVPQPVPKPIDKTITTKSTPSNTIQEEEDFEVVEEPKKRKLAATSDQDSDESENEKKKRNEGDEDGENRPRKKRSQTEDEVDAEIYARWMSVSRGFNIIHWAPIPFFIEFTCSLVLVPLMIAFGSGARVPQTGVSSFASTLMGIIGIVSPVCSIAGLVLSLICCLRCFAIPEKAKQAKQLIVISMVMFVISACIQGLFFVEETADLNLGMIHLLLASIAGLSMLGAQVTFLLFAKSTAEFLRKKGLANDASTILTQCLIFLGCSFFVRVLTASLIGAVGGGGKGFLVTKGLVVVNVALIVYASKILLGFFKLTEEMSDAVEEYASAARSANRDKRQRQRKQKWEKEYKVGDEIKVVDRGEE